MRRKLVAGNWKMNGSLASNENLLRELVAAVGHRSDGGECAVCVPFPFLSQARELLRGTQIAWGAQNLSQFDKGAYTGEVSAAMLRDFECRYVIVGHSERRAMFGDSDEVVAAKFSAALAAGLVPIACVGETLDERESGVMEQVVTRQLDAIVNARGVAALDKAVIAYEPVWAIGTGKTASPAQAQEVHALIRARVAGQDGGVASRLRVLYGGSVKAQNAAELFAMADIDGGLIGGASLVAADFLPIVRAA